MKGNEEIIFIFVLLLFVLFYCGEYYRALLKSILITSPVLEKAKEIKIKFPFCYKGFKDKFLKDFPMGDA